MHSRRKVLSKRNKKNVNVPYWQEEPFRVILYSISPQLGKVIRQIQIGNKIDYDAVVPQLSEQDIPTLIR